MVVIGGAADRVREEVDLTGVQVVENRDFGEGCATSIRTALAALPRETTGIVLLLGDQPRVSVETVQELEASAQGHAVGVCEYDDGLGHPLWFDRKMFGAARGDARRQGGVEARGRRPGADVVRVRIPGPVPRDIDTWDDYEAMRAEQA